MKALTIKQPWAWAIFNGKDCENRTWEPPKDMIGELIAIHAGKGWDDDDSFSSTFIKSLTGVDVYQIPITFGAIVGVARIAGVRTLEDGPVSPWFFGPFGWMLTEQREIEPIPCRGALGLWNLPADVKAAVIRQIEVSHA